jgi:predicted RNA-binding Zn ribbon-like protein
MEPEITWTSHAGNLGLDFLNTRRNSKGRSVDLISTPAALQGWFDFIGLHPSRVDVATSPPHARRLLDEAQRLRSAIRYAAETLARGEPAPPRTLHALNRVLGASRLATELVHHEGCLARIERETATSPLAVLAPIALAAATLLTDADPARLRQCASGRCVIWFLDSSKNGRRRWCSMARCGNRAKAARHYRKQKTAGGWLRPQ